jgi:hypothetical protein
MATSLLPEFEFYLKNRAKLTDNFVGRFIVIKNKKVIGDYGSELEAIEETSKSHQLGTFLVQQVDLDPDSTTQVFNSRVSFA